VVDLAAGASPRNLKRALEQLLVTDRYDDHAMRAVLDRAPSKRGTGMVRAFIAELCDEAAPTRSELEHRLLELVRATQLELPVVNGYVEGLQVDFHWPRYRVVVEADGRRFHGHTVAIERDRDRDLRLQLAGWRVVRLTWRQVVNEPDRVVRLLRSVLG
jgi:very-short-patch-repair endonuclease